MENTGEERRDRGEEILSAQQMGCRSHFIILMCSLAIT